MSSKDKQLSKLRYLIGRYYQHKEKFPSIDWLKKQMNISKNALIALLRSLEEDGYISRNYAVYRVEEKPPVKEKAPVVKEVEEKVQKVKEKIKTMNWAVTLIRVVMAVVAVGAIVMSLYFTAQWLMSFLSSVLSWMLSGIMILFSVFAFDIIIYVWNDRKWLSGILVLPWLLCILFSITSTVAVQYNSRIETFTSEKVYKHTQEVKTRSMAVWEEQIEDLKEQRTALNKELTIYQKELSEYASEEKRIEEGKNNFYWDAYGKIQRIKKQINDINGEIKIIQNRMLNTVEESADETETYTPSFFAWIESMFGVSGDKIEFWLSVFPAVFIDIIAPLAMAIALFLHKRKDEEDEKL